MRAVQFNQYGGPEVLRIVDVPKPQPGPGQVRIAVHAVGVNPSDWKRRAGRYQEFEPLVFPAGVGVEASGVVDQVGPGVTDASIGDALFGCGENTLAQYALLTLWARKLNALSFEVAAGLPVIIETASRALDDMGVTAGETVLMSGAAGGVGTAAIQLARRRGIRVIGTASRRNQRYLHSLGAIPTLYGPGLAQRVSTLAPEGVDAALDLAGSGIIPELIEIVGKPARVLSIADFSALRYGAKFSHGPPRQPQRVFADVARRCCEGQFQLPLQQIFEFEQAAQAQRVSAQGHVCGKLVISLR